jgi:PAT family beta-lactamase induction signal transducer AmpG
MAAILLLGIASGLPYALMDDAFRGWMTKAQLDLRTIGWFSLISLPYSLKFLWSPFLDRFVPPRLGRRRGWMVIGQLGLVVTIAILALQMAAIARGPSPTPASVLQLVALIALGITFLSATKTSPLMPTALTCWRSGKWGLGQPPTCWATGSPFC